MTEKKSRQTPQNGKTAPQKEAMEARLQADKDIDKDPELSNPDPTDNLDEGELARKDNAAEDAAI